MEVIKVKATDGLYPAAVDLPSDEFAVSKNLYNTTRNNWYYCPSADRSRYAIGVAAGTGNSGYVTSSDTAIQALSTVWSTEAGNLVGLTAGSGCYSGYNNTTGNWSGWFK